MSDAMTNGVRQPGAVRAVAANAGRPARWHLALRRYLVAIAVGNLLWEVLHLPLYTIWSTGTLGEIAFAALHCTGGDLLIALASLMIGLLVAGNGAWPDERFLPVAALTITLGVLYTVFSEWLNIVMRAAWAYSELMPVVPLFGFDVGLSPLLQWIVVPLVAFAWARRSTEAGDER